MLLEIHIGETCAWLIYALKKYPRNMFNKMCQKDNNFECIV